MPKYKPHKDERFGNLVVLEDIRDPHHRCICKCDCGNIKTIMACHLVSGKIDSCGCLTKIRNSEARTIHGLTKTKFHQTWSSIKARCFRKTHIQYQNYGARSITVCDRWKNSFLAFKEDMYQSYLDHVKEFGEKNTSIDRINNDGNYEPNNCRWATIEEQANNKTTSHFITINNETLTLSQWVRKLGVSRATVKQKIRRGMSDVDALLTSRRVKN